MADIFPGATAQQVGGYFPRSGVDPNLVLSVVHITAGLGDALSIAKSVEARQVTASFWTNRDGRIYQTMLDPARMGPWTNGVLNRPDLNNRRIAAIVRDKVNPNTRNLLTIENAGIEPGYPITAAQEAACARIIAYYHRKYGVPISRETVVGHYQYDGVNRINCPSTNKAILDRIVALAAGGSDDLSKSTAEVTKFPDGPHTLNVPAFGKIDGYNLDGLVKSVTTGSGGTSFAADAVASITQDPQKAPNGYFLRASNGSFGPPLGHMGKGLYIPHTQVVDVGPINPPPAITQEDVDAAAKAAADAVAAAADTKAAEF